MKRPIGIFVHHQGSGHATRIRALIHALPPERPVTVFCARPALFADCPESVTVEGIPSLFEATGDEAPALAAAPHPESVHCAPLGWPSIRQAMGAMAAWMRDADPALFISDVSSEVAQLARLLSVPHVNVLQHGDRTDLGHRAAYDGAAGLLAPFHETLWPEGWPQGWKAKTVFAGGLGVDAAFPGREESRAALDIAPESRLAIVISGAGGGGMALAPIALGARALPDWRWLTLGEVARDWHATEPGNLDHLGWVEARTAHRAIAAADLVVSSLGNTTCHQVLAAARPWIAVPEWCYFDEQARKGEALSTLGLAHVLPSLPASTDAWRMAADRAFDLHDPVRQTAMIEPDAANRAAAWIEHLIARSWEGTGTRMPHPTALAAE